MNWGTKLSIIFWGAIVLFVAWILLGAGAQELFGR